MSYDIPSISELEKIHLLNTHYAEVITSKEGGVSSSADITQTTNPITGVTRRTLYKILDDAQAEHDNQMQSFENDFDSRLAGMAFTRVGTFTAGATLTDMRQVLVWEASQGGDGHEYGWTGSFSPSGKVVAAGSTPATAGGIGAGAWVDRTDDTLRSNINVVVKKFNTVSEMIANQNLQIGEIVEWIGYKNIFDDGGNIGEVVASGSGIENGGTYFNLTNGLQVKSKTSRKIDARKFGYIPDSIYDQSDILINCINSLSGKGGEIELCGDIVVSKSIILTEGVSIIGIGRAVEQTGLKPSIIKSTSVDNGAAVVLQGRASSLKNIIVQCFYSSGYGIWLCGNGVQLKTVSVFGSPDHGIRIGKDDNTNTNSFLLDHVISRGNSGFGIFINSDNSQSSINANAGTFNNVSSYGNGSGGIWIKNAQKNVFNDIHVESNIGPGLLLDGSGCQYNVFVGGDVEGNTTDVTVNSGSVHNTFLAVGVLKSFVDNGRDTKVLSDIGFKFGNFGTSGYQISNSTQFLRWFEEGDFTPKLYLGPTELSAQGTPGAYSLQSAHFSRIGNRVFFEISLSISAIGAGGVGALTIRNLPYISKNESSRIISCSLITKNLSYSGVPVCYIPSPRSRIIYIMDMHSGGDLTNLTNSNLSQTSCFYISGSYLCDNEG